MDEDYFVDNYEHIDSRIFYACQNLPGPGTDEDSFQNQLSVKCDCSEVCDDKCKCLTYTGRNYSEHGRLLDDKLLKVSTGVIECNNLCSCHKNCGNRVVQFGPSTELDIFYDQLKGYCLRARKLLRKGDFICEYAGEVISRTEAKLRIKNSNNTMNYIFILKEHSGESVIETIVDPTYIGNIGRYINHSCDPNAAIIPVRFDSLVPHLAIFAICDIVPGEEIAYDYSGGEQSDFVKGLKTCHCGKINCTKFIPFNPDLL